MNASPQAGKRFPREGVPAPCGGLWHEAVARRVARQLSDPGHACEWTDLIATDDAGDGGESVPLATRYISSLYWALTTITKGLDTVREKALSCCLVMLGAGFAMIMDGVMSVIKAGEARGAARRARPDEALLLDAPHAGGADDERGRAQASDRAGDEQRRARVVHGERVGDLALDERSVRHQLVALARRFHTSPTPNTEHPNTHP